MSTERIPVKANNTKSPGIGLTERKNLKGYIFIMPFIIGLGLIFLPALFNSIRYAFSTVKINYADVKVSYTGWVNFTRPFTEDTNFIELMRNAMQGMLLDLVIITFFSFFIANILNQKFAGRGLARTIFFLPVLLATGIIAAADTNNMAMDFFKSATNTGGSIASAFTNGSSSFFDLKEMLMNANIGRSFAENILYAINNTYDIVNSSGVQILIFLSALQSIPPSIFEASKVEGATKWEEFWKITFPMLTPMILVNIVYTVVDSFANPKYKVLTYIRQTAFDNNQMGYASALAWFYFIAILLILGVIWGVIAKRIQYLD